MTSNKDEYIPALSFRALTPYYDLIQSWLVRDTLYKRQLIEQANIQPGQRVVDLGCGTGTLAIMVKQAQPQAEVLGLDADPDMLKVARAKAAQAGVEVKFDEGMTFALPYPNGSLDRVLSSIMIHHLKTPDKWRTGQEVFRVLRSPDAVSGKPGGQLHILDFGKPSSLYGKLLGPFLHGFEEANDNIDGLLPEIFGKPGLTMREMGNYVTFFGDLTFLYGQK